MPYPVIFLADADLLDGLQARRNEAYSQLYDQHYPAIERHVCRNNGSVAEAQDVFQETLLVLLARLDRPGLSLTAGLKTYVFAIAAKLWLKRLRGEKRLVPTDFEAEEHDELWGESPADSDPDPAPGLVRLLLARVTARCQQLIQALFFGEKSIQQVTEENGYTSVHNAQNQKYKCLEQVRRQVG